MCPTHQLSPPSVGMIEPSRSGKTTQNTNPKSDAKILELKSDAAMDTKLQANGYTAKQCASMTMNDKVYAVSLLA